MTLTPFEFRHARVLLVAKLVSLFLLGCQGEPEASRVDVSDDRGFLPIIDPANPCGVVCINVVSHLLERPVTLEECRRSVVEADALGRHSVVELRDGLNSLGFVAQGVKLSPEDCLSLRLPLIAHLYDGTHFAVVLPNQSDAVVILDPPTRPQRVDISVLRQMWSGTALLVANSETDLRADLAVVGILLDASTKH